MIGGNLGRCSRTDVIDLGYVEGENRKIGRANLSSSQLLRSFAITIRSFRAGNSLYFLPFLRDGKLKISGFYRR